MNEIRVYPYVETYLDKEGHRTSGECLYIKVYWDDPSIETLEHEVSFPLKNFDEAKVFMNPDTFYDAMKYMGTLYTLSEQTKRMMAGFSNGCFKFSVMDGN